MSYDGFRSDHGLGLVRPNKPSPRYFYLPFIRANRECWEKSHLEENFARNFGGAFEDIDDSLGQSD